MPATVEVRFKGTRRGFFVWHDDERPLRKGEPVIVEVERGRDHGKVQSAGATAEAKCGSCASGGCSTSPLAGSDGTGAPAPDAGGDGEPLRPVLRRASAEDLRIAQELRRQEESDRLRVIERVAHHQLQMKVSDLEWQWDRQKLSIFFTAEKRVDFRQLVRDLASRFRTRIELRQIGVRDEAARLGGVGRCGKEFCCSTWLTEIAPVNLSLAKDQHLALNPVQISGGCGRLLCCLRYEHDFYVEQRRRFPKEGRPLRTAIGMEKVVAVDIFRERVMLRAEDGATRTLPLLDLQQEVERLGGSLRAGAAAPAVTARDDVPSPES